MIIQSDLSVISGVIQTNSPTAELEFENCVIDANLISTTFTFRQYNRIQSPINATTVSIYDVANLKFSNSLKTVNLYIDSSDVVFNSTAIAQNVEIRVTIL